MINWKYIYNQLQKYPQCSDKTLYKIAIHAELLVNEDFMNQRQGYALTPEMRSHVLNWLRSHADQIGIMI